MVFMLCPLIVPISLSLFILIPFISSSKVMRETWSFTLASPWWFSFFYALGTTSGAFGSEKDHVGFWDQRHLPALDHISGTFGGLCALSWSPPIPSISKPHFFSEWWRGRGLVGTLNLVTNHWNPIQTTFKKRKDAGGVIYYFETHIISLWERQGRSWP